MSKLGLIVGVAAGYVIGARAGRDRYEQIKQLAGQAWNNPAVVAQRARTTEQIKQKGPEVAAAAGQAAVRGAGQAAKSAVVAGFQAAVGTKPGPVVQGTIADGASYDTTSASARRQHDDVLDQPASPRH
ncbi:YtxH domain-containing protein [Rudaeicoccus suwonensis]|uniref:YtxH-like protein n=1 Tax=Rudaeicoccus suwonensis TaxID=657409 RepID=A0A561E6Z7_9MICO|nr:YtxH domain-containing protein [Rudaeicoccus suwonensis]TWE11396.1 hypothetical protein BKA23_0159 [Rudaeicoccus suwonensis]